MKIKVSEATPIQLNWAVAKCEGLDYWQPDIGPSEPAYSTDWSQGGPIIEREGINIVFQGDAHDWVASLWSYKLEDWHLHTEGPTPLIAAMRCFVTSKLGNEVDVPDELLGGTNPDTN